MPPARLIAPAVVLDFSAQAGAINLLATESLYEDDDGAETDDDEPAEESEGR